MSAVASRVGERIERRHNRRHRRAKAADHILEHVIAANAQSTVNNLDLRVSISEVPGQAHKAARRSRIDFTQWLRLASDGNNRSVVKDKTVTVPQRHRSRQIEQKLGPVLAGQNDTPAVAIVGAENDLVESGGAPRPGWSDCTSALHAHNIIESERQIRTGNTAVPSAGLRPGRR
jgi:hypothetical protein